MRSLALALLLCSYLGAQSLDYYLDPSGGASPVSSLSPLQTSYAFPDTPVGSVSSTIIRVVNSGTVRAQVDLIYVGAAAGSSYQTPNFTVTGYATGSTIAPGSFKLFTFNFTPSTTGISFGYLQASVGGSQVAVSTAAGNGTAPQVTLSCSSSVAAQCNGATLQPSSSSPINFGNTLTTNTTVIPFTLTNGTTSAINPQTFVSLTSPTNNPNNTFALSTLTSTLAPNASLTFTVTFSPGTANTYQTNLVVGTSSYPLQGSGYSSVVGDISSLVVTYVDSTGVRLTAQPATPISFGQNVAGSSSTATLTFTVSNPQTTISSVAVSALSVSGTGFSLTSGPSLPVSIAPGGSTTFKLVFNPTTTGTFSGILSIGTRLFSVTGTGTVSSIPDPSFQIDVQPLVNQKQANLSISFPTASPVSAIGTLTMTFAPSVSGVSDDPAVVFTATSGRQLQIDLANGGTVGTYSGQTALTFQSGTTAGTLTFTLTFPNKTPYSQSFTIGPAQVQITSSSTVRQSPNLVITMVGFDNTYSLGQLGFTFYDTAGKAITTQPISVDAASSFKQLFFTSNQAGGAFSLRASFPVVGDVTQVGSVAVTLKNSSGTTTSTNTFQ